MLKHILTAVVISSYGIWGGRILRHIGKAIWPSLKHMDRVLERQQLRVQSFLKYYRDELDPLKSSYPAVADRLHHSGMALEVQAMVVGQLLPHYGWTMLNAMFETFSRNVRQGDPGHWGLVLTGVVIAMDVEPNPIIGTDYRRVLAEELIKGGIWTHAQSKGFL